MPDWLISIPAFIVAIGVLVAVHEFGHFWVARRCGVRVLRYSIGFGSAIWSRVSPKTGIEYRVAAIPLGGYVKMLDEREGPVPASEADQAFNRQTLWKRAAIVAAGPGINFAFAVLAYWLVFMLGVAGIKPLVAEPETGTAAQAIGLQAGDRVLSLDGQAVPTWQDLRLALIGKALDGSVVDLEYEDTRGSRVTRELDMRNMSADPEKLFPALGLSPYRPPGDTIIVEPLDGSPAQQAGLQPQDRVKAVNGEPVASPQAFIDWVKAHPGETAQFNIERDGAPQTLSVRIGAEQDGASGDTTGRIGAQIGIDSEHWEAMQTERRLGPLAAVPAAVSETWSVSALTVRLLWRMVTGDVSWKNISGPIQIADYAGKTASVGLEPFLSFLALISVSLAVLNLLPVPVLDGGHLLYYAFEFVRGRPLSDKVQAAGQQLGVLALLMLMSLAFYNDILRLLG